MTPVNILWSREPCGSRVKRFCDTLHAVKWHVLTLAVLASAWPAGADERAPAVRLVADAAIVEPTQLADVARIVARVSAIDLQGAVLPIRDVEVKVGSRKVPVAVGQARGADIATAVVLVVAATADFGDSATAVQAAINDELLANFAKDTQIAWITYGASLGGTSRLGGLKSGDFELVPDAMPTAPVFLDAVERGLSMLTRWRPKTSDARRLLVVLSDGIDGADDRIRVTELGQRAGAGNIRIHSLAYSPSDTRRPLLALGELSRKSGGTFRWIRTNAAQAFRDQVRRLREEIDGQYVLVGLAAPDELAGKSVTITANLGGDTLTANSVSASRLICAGTACDGACVLGMCTPLAPPPRLPWLRFVVMGLGGFAGLIGLWLFVRKIGQGRTRAALVIIGGAKAGQRFALRRRAVIGSHAIADIVLTDPRMAPRHARIERRGPVYYIIDEGTPEGITVNGRRVKEAALDASCTIRIGSTDFRFMAE